MAKGTWRTLKRLILILTLVIVTAVLALLLWTHFYDARLERQFHRITTGMSKDQVLSLMGKPDSTGKCGEWGGGVVPAGCHQEYIYKPLLNISTLAVFLDSKDRVVGKYDYESP